MSKKYSLDNLLVQSQSLNTHRDGLKRMRRGVAELADASRSLASSGPNVRSLEMGGDQKAFRILSQHAFDAEGLMKEVNSMELKAQYDPMERLEGTDIEGYLSHHHDMIILSAIDEARRVAEKDVSDIQKRWATEEWVSSRKEMMESLGHRSHHWTGGATPAKGSSTLSSAYRSAHVEELTSTPRMPYSAGVSGGEALYRGDVRGTPPTVTPSKQQSRFKSSPATEPWSSSSASGRENAQLQGVPQQSPLLRGHAEVVRKLHQLHQKGDRSVNGTLEGSGGRNGMALVEVGGSSSSLSISSTGAANGALGGGRVVVGANAALFPTTALANELEACTSNLTSHDVNGMTRNDITAYHALLEVTASMTGESEGRTFPAAYFSPVALDHPDVTSEIVGDRRRILSRGARVFLERQFETMVVTTLDSNTSLRGDAVGNDRTPGRQSSSAASKTREERIRTFVQLEAKAHRIPQNCLAIRDSEVGRVQSSALSMSRSRGSSGDMGRESGVPVWPQVYYCLRAGALKEAKSILQKCVSEGVTGVDVAALAAVDELLHLQEREQSEEGSTGVYRHVPALLAALSKCAALYRHAVDALSQSGNPAGGGDRAYMGDLTDGSMALDMGGFLQESGDPYRLQVLNLLGLADLDSLCTGEYLPNTTTEDFLWCSLWFIHWTQSLAAAHELFVGGGGAGTGDDIDLPGQGTTFQKSASAGASFLSSSSLSLYRGASVGSNDDNLRHNVSAFPARKESYSATKRLLNKSLPKIYSEGDILLRAIEAGGPDYFDPQRNAPFTYALILFCCHRFGEAISHLWQTRRTFPAVHLLVVCLHYGLVLPHTPLCSATSGLQDSSGAQLSASSLLTQWTSSSRIAALDSRQKVDYLVGLNSRWLSHVKGLLKKDLFEVSRFKTDDVLMCAIEQLLCTLNEAELSLLVGEANSSTGMRLSGHLDVYLEREMVNTILARTAYSLTTVQRETQLGIRLYELAGMYVEVLEELCNQLSLCMILTPSQLGSSGSQKQAAREYWKEACIAFYDRLLDSSSAGNAAAGVVTDTLQQAGRLGLRVTFETLLNLCMFTDRCYNKRYQEALDYIDNLGLLPTSGSENGDSLSSRVHRFHQLETPVRRVMDDVMLLCMECIQHLHAEARNEGAGVSHLSADRGDFSVARDKRLQALRARASVLVTFAGYVQSRLTRPADTTSKLATMDVNMM